MTQVRELLHDFYGSRYASCLRTLAALRPSLALDMYLAPHVEALYSAIRQRALIQYTAPFTSVSLATMAEAFSSSVRCAHACSCALVHPSAAWRQPAVRDGPVHRAFHVRVDDHDAQAFSFCYCQVSAACMLLCACVCACMHCTA